MLNILISNFVLWLAKKYFFFLILNQFFVWNYCVNWQIFKRGCFVPKSMRWPMQSEIPSEIFLERKFETDATDINIFDKISTQSL